MSEEQFGVKNWPWCQVKLLLDLTNFTNLRSLRSKGAVDMILSFIATLFSFFVFNLLMILTKVTPKRYRLPSRSKTSQKKHRPRRFFGGSIILLLVYIYRRSLLRDRLCRTGYSCRFIPSCTEYAARAVQKFGFGRGLLMTGGRFYRCNPEYNGDYIDFP